MNLRLSHAVRWLHEESGMCLVQSGGTGCTNTRPAFHNRSSRRTSMATNIVSQEPINQGPIFPECFVQDINGSYAPDPTTVIRQYGGWHGDPWRTRATMAKIRLNQGAAADCPAHFLSLAENGDMYLTRVTEQAVLPAGTKLVTGVTRHSPIDRVASLLQEASSQAA